MMCLLIIVLSSVVVALLVINRNLRYEITVKDDLIQAMDKTCECEREVVRAQRRVLDTLAKLHTKAKDDLCANTDCPNRSTIITDCKPLSFPKDFSGAHSVEGTK
jgi:predicted Holliday junction resolvase-like endonuclease